MFDLTLNPEGAGWLRVHVELDGDSWDFTASDLGPDLCEQLIAAGNRLKNNDKDGSFATAIEMYGEPEGFTLYISEEEEITFLRLYHIEDFDVAPKGELGDCLKKAQSSRSEISEVIYRALRNLLLEHGLQYLSAEWQEFPLGAFILLHRALGREPTLSEDGFDAEMKCLQSLQDA